MKWFEGSIPEAIALAKSKQQLFLVFIEGNDELSKSMGTTYEDAAVASKLQGSKCVAIKLRAGSEPCQQFSQIYPVVVVPSSFFIGCNGIPLEVIAGSVEPPELLNRIEKLFQEPVPVNDNGNLPAEPPLEPKPSTPTTAAAAPSDTDAMSAASLEERVERAKRLVEERRLQKMKEEEEAVKQSELERRRVAREMQLAQQAREDQERREWARKRAQEKEEERRHRERIQAQIAQDRADRAERYQQEKTQEEQRKREREAQRLLEQQQRAAQEAAARSQVARIQFRLPDGSSAAHTFDADATLQELHNYVVETLQPSFSTFTLSTTFPRREFTQEQYRSTLRELELAPSAVILVVPVSTPSVVVPAALNNSGASLMKLLWSLLAPFGVIWSLFVGLIFGSPDPPASASVSDSGSGGAGGASQRGEASASFGAQESQAAQGGARRRRSAQQPTAEGVYQRDGNVYRFSNQRFSDDDDDTNTWNGNSTQQM
uniref:UBX domain-containing protein 4 n=1 Tax=Amblyomma aureolatum TaxID=187763 RepID=A0A1E1X506_9ACAR